MQPHPSFAISQNRKRKDKAKLQGIKDNDTINRPLTLQGKDLIDGHLRN